jgi:hypothetical protein
MPSWGRPPGGRGVGKYMEEVEDVYRFQEVDSEDEKGGVLLDAGYQRDSNGKQSINPDELYFNGMDLREWERRTADLDGLAYGDEFGYPEEEGYYEDAGDLAMAITEYEDLLFQRVLDKIRMARATGDPDVQLSPEELEIYQARLSGQRVPAARPQPPSPRHVSAPIVSSSTSTAVAPAPSTVGASGSGSTRAKKSSRRTSLFGSRRPKDKDKEKSSTRTRAPSMSSEAINPPPPPGFVVPGPNGQPAFAPLNAYHGHRAQDSRVRPPVSPPRRSSRSASASGDRLSTGKVSLPLDTTRPMRPARTPPRISSPKDMPGTFPSDTSQIYRAATPQQHSRPASSSSRQSTQDNIDPRNPSSNRPHSSSSQQTTKLVPLAMPEYKHHTAEPFQYQVAGHLATSQFQPPYTRRVSSGSAVGSYTSMPRRVPVPVQRAPGINGVHGSYSDPAVLQRAEVSDVDEDEDADVVVDVVPSTDDKSYKVQTSKSTGKEGSSGGSVREGERRKRSSKTRRKH